MKSKIICVLLVCMTSYGCTVLKQAYKPAVRVYSDDNSSMKTYKTFDFRMTGDSLDYLLENYLQNHLAILLESKGFERANSPDFYISIIWETLGSEILYDTGFIVAGVIFCPVSS